MTLVSRWVAAAAAILFFSSCTRQQADTVPTLNIPLIANVKGLDPVQTTDLYSAMVVAQIYECLYQYNYLKRPFTIEPLLAAGPPEVSKDGLTHTIKIRPGVMFQDDAAFPGGKGREVTTQDFIYAWKRLADARSQSEGFWIFDGKVKGYSEWRKDISSGKATYDTPIVGLQAPDKYTLVITLTRPYFQLEYVLTLPYSSVVAKEAVDKYGLEFLNHPVGTGPYVLDSWTRNSKLQLSKNPHWHGGTYPTEGEASDAAAGLLKDAGQPLPFVSKLIFHELTEDQPRWLNFMKGNLDVVGIPKDNFESAISGGGLTSDMAKKGFHLTIVNEPDITYTAFNMEDPIVGKNINLRKAIAHALDHKTEIQKFYNNRAISAESPISPDMDGYDPGYKDPNKTYDVAKAKEFMVKAGYPGGKGLPPLEYSTISGSTSRQMAEFVQQSLSAIGIQLKIVTTSWPQFLERLAKRQGQVWGAAWIADYPDPESDFQLLYSKNASPGANSSNYTNKAFDALYDQAAILPPGAARTKVYLGMRDLIAKDVPWVYGVHRQGWYLSQGWLSNFKPNAGIINAYKYLRVTPEKKSELKAKL